ncbi:TIGR01621 family pseudouridine synthase [Pasteurella skyensis]|uniref:TIGR01621 family pseudouridine synthase n=1 Tax=Phocoenobacter skyensis TaxID=97481 RepID=A0AAJ6N8L2_9PAST|nr:TIGR01621 family pseudouridine synthase [Pasteurella skyensis]MDP8162052.1 TIGR01621 family pseudouridine synthase [Pasteurella skyensis]MDP8172208.1 TIGR01621 family pseudouridine synthase [Pasteurella skyensis]MDP8176443.1 TIGR01621 family pseudouridine synthase [Pasteurella skyensis]MDP8178332.1 TIGR01621 family pseudouridine synthase [Pasteurella skyensis]MDP8182912.1 TIGR01621 family pseudouridine synthase [Pasteurella skyensis]
MSKEFEIYYHHNDFVIINKPASVSVHKDNEETGLTTQLAQQLNVEQVWLVHRLDKVTSGLLILALKREVAVTFSQLFANHQIQKTYWALATNKPKKKQGKIVGDMERTRNGAWKLCHTKQNPAITQFHSRSIAPNLRHFILQPKTGKTHQLRVAMKSLGSPILGDRLYSGDTADRVYLHAYQLEFIYQNQTVKINCAPKNGVLWQKLDI